MLFAASAAVDWRSTRRTLAMSPSADIARNRKGRQSAGLSVYCLWQAISASLN